MSSFASSGSRTPPRLRLITRAPWSTAQRIAATSPSSEISPSRLDDLRDHELRVEREPCDPLVVGRVRGDLAGDERAVTLRVAVGRAADERLRGDDPPHRDPDGRRRCPSRSPRPGSGRASAAPARTTTRCPARGTTASPRAARCCRTRATRQAARVRAPRPRARAAVSRHRDRSREAGREPVARRAADAIGARRERLGEAERAAGVGGAGRKRRPDRAPSAAAAAPARRRAPGGIVPRSAGGGHAVRRPAARPAIFASPARDRAGRRAGTASRPCGLTIVANAPVAVEQQVADRRPVLARRSSLRATRRPRRARSPSARRRRRR